MGLLGWAAVQRRLVRGCIHQSLGQLLGRLELGHTLRRIYLRTGDAVRATAALARTGMGRQQHPFTPAHHAPGIGAQFKAAAPVAAALRATGGLGHQVAQVQLAGRRTTGQAHT